LLLLTGDVTDAFKIQSHLVFFDTAHNSRQAVLGNAYTAFVETATKMWAYARCLPKEKRPGLAMFVGTQLNSSCSSMIWGREMLTR